MDGPVLVTGAAGFAGGHLVSLLRADGPVVGWYRPGVPPPPASLALGPDVSWVAVDLTDAAAVDAAIADLKPSAVHHLAGAANQGAAWAHSDVTLELNVRVTHVLLRAVARHVPTARVLVTTSAAIYAASDAPLREDDPIAPATPYAVSKLAQEMVALDAARDGGLDVIVARPFNHIGTGQDLGFFAPAFARQVARIEAGLEPGPMRVGNLTPRRDLCDVRDTVRAYRLLVQGGARGQVYNVCRGEAIAISALLDMLRAQAAVPIDVEVDPARLRPVDLPVLVGDHGRLTATTGWTPQIPLADTITALLEEQRALIPRP
ncbi:NAD-dependent epimerase/dehydratase family protein [Luteitalea sp.]|jgi:GDP-4-dehydro-6-deoxy-D-mannose reductase|uniref:NAD-dependent epimerase/dehydratase family protein n=1 Tax=Luteitalea sp. TaxID=2004800 RepID=UPI0037CA7A19